MLNIKPIRTVEWSVSADLSAVTPSTPVPAGVQGEDNATLAIFHLGAGSPLANPVYQLYVECVNTAGEYDKTQPLTVTPEGDVNVLIPLAWTQYGGENIVRLVAVQDGQIVYTVEGRMVFAGRNTAARKVDGLLRTDIQQTLDKSRQWADEAKSSADTAVSASEQASQCALDALNSAVKAGQNEEKIAQLVMRAQSAATAAAHSAESADAHAFTAADAAGHAEQEAKNGSVAADSAADSERAAQVSAKQAASSAAAAQTSKTAADAAEQEALVSAHHAVESASAAESFAVAASTSADSAVSSAAQAEFCASRAEKAADNAGTTAVQQLEKHNHDFTAHSQLFAKVADLVYTQNNFANALRNTASGEMIAIDDVSPIEHDVRCRVFSKNMVAPDGIYKQSEYSWFVGYHKGFALKAGKNYTLSVSKKLSGLFVYDFETKKEIKGSGVYNADVMRYTPEKDSNVYLRLYNSTGNGAIPANLSIQFEQNTEATPYSPPVLDLTEVKVILLGKNLLDTNKFRAWGGEGNVRIEKDTVILDKAANMHGIEYTGDCSVFLVGKTYVFSCADIVEHDASAFGTRVVYQDGTYSSVPSLLSTPIRIEKPVASVIFYCGMPYMGNADVKFKQPMAALQEFDGVYEPYQRKDYIPLADGTVPHVRSLSSHMSLFTDTEGVLMDTEYIADTKRYIDKAVEKLRKAVM